MPANRSAVLLPAALLAVSVGSIGCERTRGAGPDADPGWARVGEVAVDPGATRPEPVAHAIAVLHGTDAAPDLHGIVRFDRRPDGVAVVADVAGLTPGRHAYHLHVYGDCSAGDGTSAGTHFNLRGSSLDPGDDIDRITGDLGELVADESGRAHAETLVSHATLHGRYSILGRSVVVHAKGNDPSKPPMGAAGGRLGCGVVGIAQTTA